jgi:hypothetical protein
MSDEFPVSTPRYRQSKFWADWFERVAWTAAQAGIAAVSFDQFDMPLWSLPIVAAALSAVKGWVARHAVDSNEDSASTVPGV